jgi:hypothetical protein
MTGPPTETTIHSIKHQMFSIYLLLKMQSNLSTIYGICLGVDGGPEKGEDQ